MDDGTKLFTGNVLYHLWPQEGECAHTYRLIKPDCATGNRYCLVPASKKAPPSKFNRLSVALDHM